MTAYQHGVRHDRCPGSNQRVELPLAGDGSVDNGPGINGGPEAASVRAVRHVQAVRQRPRACTGGQDRRATMAGWWRPPAARAVPISGCTFPVLVEESLDDPARQRTVLRGRLTPPTILIADDDRSIRTVLTQALGRSGYQVRSTSNAATLWRWVEDGEGDLVITDVVMPDENGLDLIPRIKRLRPELRVIVMSAQSTLMTAVKAAQRGAFEYLPKPFDLKELLAVVGRALAVPAPAVRRRRRSRRMRRNGCR